MRKDRAQERTDMVSGTEMYKWATDLYPICRSLTGPGVRSTLSYISKLVPDLNILSVDSGTKVFDWTVPDEWLIRDAWIKDESGKKLVDFQNSNLHVVGYSEPVDLVLDLEELQAHLHSLPGQPQAIPYVTSYYEQRWGFCVSHEKRQLFKPGQYHVVIDSELKPGVLNYAELVIPGESTEEVFLSTYICHPSMANNELSGPVVTTAIAKWLLSLESRKYTYRIVFIPETIGSLVYLSKHMRHLKDHVVAGFNISCIGDNRTYSYLPSRCGVSISDRVAQHVLKHIDPNYKSYSWLDRGSDERQYCAPGIDLPIATIMRSKYAEYPEYHTSLDDLSVISPVGLDGGATALRLAIECLEENCFPKASILGEPQLGARGLYPNISVKSSVGNDVELMMNVLTYADGLKDLLEISDIVNEPFSKVLKTINLLIDNELVKI